MPPVTGPSSCFARTSKTKMEACHWLHAYCRAPFRQGKPASRCVYSMHVYVSFEDTQHLCIYGFPKLYSSDHFFPPKKTHGRKEFHGINSFIPQVRYIPSEIWGFIKWKTTSNPIESMRSFGKIFRRLLCMFQMMTWNQLLLMEDIPNNHLRCRTSCK